MDEKNWVLELAGLRIACSFGFPDTHRFFEEFSPPNSFREADASSAWELGPISMSEECWADFEAIGLTRSARSEYSFITQPVSDALLRFDRMIVHGVALRWRDRAWLICAPSGVGKSTQARILQELRPGEFGVICGDRPILEFCHCDICRDEHCSSAASPVLPSSVGAVIGRPPETTILVHPSPWNGKENWSGAPAAPLAGLIFLERGEENRVAALSKREAVLPAFSQVIQSLSEPETIHCGAVLLTQMLNDVPIWRLTTHQPPASTKLLLETVFPT